VKKTILVVMTAIFCLYFTGAAAAEDADVVISADVTQNLQILEGTVTVRFHRQELYNEGVKLSWHIYSESGELLVFENERCPLAVENGEAEIPLKIEMPPLDTQSAVVRFDLVDEENVYWFSENPSLTVRQDEVGFVPKKGVVRMEGDFPAEITGRRLNGNLTVRFEDPAWYNDQVKLSWHIYGPDGERLAYENERLALPPLEDGEAVVPLAIDFSQSGAVSGVKVFSLQFDLVDEGNGFWFSEYAPVELHAVEARYQYRLGSEFLAVMKNAAKEQPLLLGLNVTADILLIAGCVILKRRKDRTRPDQNRPEEKRREEKRREHGLTS